MFSLIYRKGDNNPTHMSRPIMLKMVLQSIDLYEACILNQDVWNVNVFFSQDAWNVNVFFSLNQRVFDVC